MVHEKAFRRGAGLLALGLALPLIGCDTVDDLLEAKNPEAIREEQLDNPALVKVLVNSVVGRLTTFYHTPFIWAGNFFTDEQVTGINWEGTARLNLRVVQWDGADEDMFPQASEFRFMADSVTTRLATLLENPASDRRMALMLAHAGYAYTLMAEVMCEATVNVGATIYSSEELAAFAVPRFEEAIQVATAAGASADDVRNLASVGLARVALLLGDNAKVVAAAGDVPLDFDWWVEYQEGVLTNVMNTRVTGGNHALGVHPRFLNGPFGEQDIVDTQTDPRIQHTTTWTRGHNALTKLYKPFQTLSYSGYNSQTIADGGEPILFEQSTNIKLASGLEAMHHYYEAAGPNGTGLLGTTLEFVNERRAYGNQAPVDLSGDALMKELREQRARDLYLGGFRMGDLRRWDARGIQDPDHSFPTGTHPNPEWGPYGSATCYPLPREEYVGNPNIKR